MPHTCHRPTAYRRMTLGGAWNAYLNWAWARRTSCDFVIVFDDLCAEYQATWMQGETCRVMRPRYEEDLEWFGMKPDRVYFSGDNRAQHLEVAGRLGIREAQSVAGHRLWAAGLDDHYDPCDWDTLPTDGSAENWIEHDTGCWNPWYMACCIADDIAFGITGWLAGKDQEWYKAWCLSAYEALCHPAPRIQYHRVLKRQAANAKISKSSGEDPTIGALRRAGYEPEAILETLRELTTRAKRDGLEEVIIPHGVLTLDEVGCLQEREYALEELAAGEFDNRDDCLARGMTDEEIDRLRGNIMVEAQRRMKVY